MRTVLRVTSTLGVVVVLSLAVTGVLAWWVAVVTVYAGCAASSLLGALRRPDDPAGQRLSASRVRTRQALLRGLGWAVAVTAVFVGQEPWGLALLPVVVLERAYAAARNSDVLLYDDRLVTESESWFSEELPVSEIVGLETGSTAWSETRRLVVVSNPARRTPLLPCREGSDNAAHVLAWARERGIAVPSGEDGVARVHDGLGGS